MSLRYTPILQAQPADGAVVFVRRFTRDPPVRAIWSLSAQTFTLLSSLTAVITGGTNAGAYTLPYVALPAPFTGFGWALQIAPFWLLYRITGTNTSSLSETDLTTAAYFHDFAAIPAIPFTQSAFTTFGTPPWTAPTSITIGPFLAAPLVLPVYVVQAWRPL